MSVFSQNYSKLIQVAPCQQKTKRDIPMCGLIKTIYEPLTKDV